VTFKDTLLAHWRCC